MPRQMASSGTPRSIALRIKGKTVAWVGDGNNMANTWLQASEILGFKVHLSTPGGYEVDQSIAGIRSSDSYQVFSDPMQACAGAEDDNPSLLKVADRPPRNICLGHLAHGDSALHARFDARLLQEVL